MRVSIFPAAAVASLVNAIALPQAETVAEEERHRFSNASWPLPHNITGVDQAGQDTPTQGWGGVHVHDPSVILGPDGHYWSFSTHGLIAISRASRPGTLKGYWDVVGSVLVNESVIVNSGRTDPWAPDVSFANGQYHCYYAVSQFGSQISAIGLATSKSLLPGTWTDHGQVIASGPGASFGTPLNITNAIDPNYFRDPNSGKSYLSYGSFWSDIWTFRLTPSLQSITYHPPPIHQSLDPVSPQAEEGAYLSFHNGWYYMWYSHGQCCGFDAAALPAPGSEYSIRVGRARAVEGPFVDREGVGLVDGGGEVVFGSHGTTTT